ncbi:3196_t:CDS:2, partial [Funneliformis geosporum]
SDVVARNSMNSSDHRSYRDLVQCRKSTMMVEIWMMKITMVAVITNASDTLRIFLGIFCETFGETWGTFGTFWGLFMIPSAFIEGSVWLWLFVEFRSMIGGRINGTSSMF